MPREIVHWGVLQGALDRIGEREGAGRLADVLPRHRAAALLGAMAPDAPYYHAMGRSDFGVVAERIHGTWGGDTLEVPRALARRVREREGEEAESLLAFLVGYQSHRAADIAFHPATFYLTGDIHARVPSRRFRARRAHNLFEVRLDAWWQARVDDGVATTRINDLLDEVGDRLEGLAGALDADAPAPDGSPWKDALVHLGRLQAVFRSAVLGTLARGLARVDGRRLVVLDSLFALGRRAPVPFFDEPFAYRHPVTGEHLTRSVRDLGEQAVEETVDAALALASLLEDPDADPDRTLGEGPGVSLDSGVAGAGVDRMEHFAETPPAFLEEG